MMTIGRVTFDDDESIVKGLQTFEYELGDRGTQFFAGNKPGMLDFMIWPWCERADILKLFGNQHLLRRDKYKKLVRCLFLLSTILKMYFNFRWSGVIE